MQTVLDGVTEYLKDKEIRGLDCYPGTVVKDPELAKNPFPARLSSHERRGKYMILHLSGESSLIIHLRMTGKLVQGEAMPGKSPHERACFLLSGGKKLHFIDNRTFGKIVLCKTANLGKFMPDLGIEPLSAGFTGKYLARLFARRKTPIKNILMDQSKIAGLGNIYATEILYRSRIHPETPAGEISLPRLSKLAAETKAVLKQAIAMNGTSISDFRRVDDKSGGFRTSCKSTRKTPAPRGTR